jgi:hypothetical protein
VPLLGEDLGPELALCNGDPPVLVTDFEVRQTPDLPEPQARAPFRDPVFGTCVIRVTDRQSDLSPDDDSGGLKNEYSRVQSFNADGTLLVARGTEATWYLYDALSLQPLGEMPVEVEPRWDAGDPHVLNYIDETRLMSLNVRTGHQAVIHDFASDVTQLRDGMVWTRYEGSPSFDGRTWGLMAQQGDGRVEALLVYDRAEDRVVATRDVPRGAEIDSVTISPRGTTFLAYFDDYCEQGDLGDDDHPCGLMAYDRELRHGRGLVRIIGHSDAALDAEGREVLIFQNIDTDHISLLYLSSGEVVDLFPIDFSHSPIGLHFSGRASFVPGWAVVSTYSGGHPVDQTWMDDSVFAVELKPGGRLVRFAHTHSLVDENQEHDYWAEPQASVNRDFTRVVFTSNWGRSGSDEVEMFMVSLQEGWTDGLR